MNKKLKIMFIPLEFVGHINSNLGLAQTLRDRGHHIIFAIDSPHKDLVDKYGFDIEIVDNKLYSGYTLAELESKKSVEFGFMSKRSFVWTLKMISNAWAINIFLMQVLYHWFNKDYKLQEIIAECKPDILICDDIFCYPSIIYSKIPFVWIFSANPLSFYLDPKLPPPLMGFPTNRLETNWKMILVNFLTKAGTWISMNYYSVLFFLRGYNCNPERRHVPYSDHLNIYCYPKELDYEQAQYKYKNVFRIDTSFRYDLDHSRLSDDLNQFIKESKNTKLIFVALGSFCSADVEYMKNLVRILSKSKNRFIISKGIYHDQYQLASNMWGDKFVPQKQIIPLVDLVITHGGNNSVIEAFSFGKPMIVIPIWLDQFDNAQRIQELNYGIQLDRNDINETNLLDAIETLLANKTMKDLLSRASKRILSSDSLTKAAEKIENLIVL